MFEHIYLCINFAKNRNPGDSKTQDTSIGPQKFD